MNRKPPTTTFYARLFSRLYDPVMRSFEDNVLLLKRRELLGRLHGHVLEVGAGTGVNFALYPSGTQVIACEPSQPMLSKALQKLEQTKPQASIRLVHAGIGDADLARLVPEEGLDAAVFTLVLCTIPHPEEAVETVKKWLKPGGKLIVLEHIGSRKSLGRTVQRAIEPVWTPLAEGCRLTRDTDLMLKRMGFVPEWEQYFSTGMRFYQAVLALSAPA